MSEKAITIMKNMAVPYIKVENNTNGNLHAFEVVNVEWVPKNTIQNTLKFSEAAIMNAKCFVKHEFPF
jgi:hypothetical protein